MKRWLIEWFEARGGPNQYFSSKEFPGLDKRQVRDFVEMEVSARNLNERFIFSIIALLEWYSSFSIRVQSFKEAVKF